MIRYDPPADPYGDERHCRICDFPLTYNPLIRGWECQNNHDNPAEPPTYYVTIYLDDRAFGGSEEGGWYYDCGEPQLIPFEGISRHRSFDGDYAEIRARRYAASLKPLIKRLNEGRHDKYSVLSRGEYAVHIEEEPPAPYPTVRPHYE